MFGVISLRFTSLRRLVSLAAFIFLSFNSAHAQRLSNSGGEFVLTSGQRLLGGQTAVAYGGYRNPAGGWTVVLWPAVAELAMQTDGNLIYSTAISPNSVLTQTWVSGTSGNPGAYLEMQVDGNLVLYRPDRTPLWASNTNGYGSQSYMRLQSDGNLVVYSRSAIWASGSRQTTFLNSGQAPQAIDRMVRGDMVFARNQQFYVTLQSDHNLVINRNGGGTLWATGRRGDLAAVQADGNFVLYDGYGSAVWASNTQGYGPSVELLMQDDGNLVLYGDRARWTPANELRWYERLCARITCQPKYTTTFSAANPGPSGGGGSGGGSDAR